MNPNFIPEVYFDEGTQSYTLWIKNLNIVALGDSLETAADQLLEKIEFLALTFFDNSEAYRSTEFYQDYYDYFLGVSKCTKSEFIGMINPQN